MAFVKPYTYVDGSVLDAENQNLNDEAAKTYVNQGISTLDYANGSIGTENIARGEIEPITKSHRFETGHHYAAHNGIETTSRAYYTSHIKPRNQQSNTFFVYAPLWETGTEVNLEYDADIIFDFGGTFISLENDPKPQRWWDSVVFLEMYNVATNETTRYGVTRSYSFEEVPVDSSNPTAGGNVDPFNGYYINNTIGNESEAKFSVRRWIGFRKKLTFPPGRYQFRVVINPKVEQGFTSARNFTTEVFYKIT
jgi:hypothetical protein